MRPANRPYVTTTYLKGEKGRFVQFNVNSGIDFQWIMVMPTSRVLSSRDEFEMMSYFEGQVLIADDEIHR